MNDLPEREREKAQKELDRFIIVREWKKGERVYDLRSVRPEKRFLWERFGEDRSPLIGLEQLHSEKDIYKSKLVFNAFFMTLMLSAKDMPEDMTLRIGVGAWYYGKFMRKHYLFAEQYRESLHYLFDQLTDDYLLMIKDERRIDRRLYVKLYGDGRIRIVKLVPGKSHIEETEIGEDLLSRISDKAKALVTEDKLQEIQSNGDLPERCVMLKFGLNIWDHGDPDKSYQNEYITESSRYDFVNELLQLECMRDFR